MAHRFAIGDLVYLRVGITNAMLQCRAGAASGPQSFVVIERLTQECHGGTQYSYVLSQGEGSRRFQEEEVAALSEWDAEAAREACQKVQETVAQAKREADAAYWELRAARRNTPAG